MRLDHFAMYPERAFNKVAGRMTFEGGGKGSAPPAPDYTAAAQQTAAGNLANASLSQYGNMVNQVTPQGTVTYTPQTQGYINSSNQRLSLDDYNARKANGEDVSGWNPLNQWTQTVSLSPEQQAAYNKDVQVNAGLQDAGIKGLNYVQQALDKPLAAPPETVKNVALSNFTQDVGTQKYKNSIDDAGKIQRYVDDPTLTQQQVTDALYGQQTQYLDPQFNQSQSRLENQLANQGITRGSEAWNNAMGDFARQKQQAYSNARDSAIGQGVNAANTLYQNKLAGGNFVNAAQGQQFGQNQAQQQAFNQAQQAMFDQLLANANLKNTAQSQLFNQGLSNANLKNAGIQQDFQNAQTVRNDPINMLNAVRTGSQMQSSSQPAVSVSSPGQMATVSGPDYLSAATAQGQYNMNQYNANQASSNNLMSGLFGLGSAGLGAYGMMNMKR